MIDSFEQGFCGAVFSAGQAVEETSTFEDGERLLKWS
jgi:hypothetical protein